MHSIRPLLPILFVCLYASGMGIFFAACAARYPNASGTIPAALAFVAVALLGATLMSIIGQYEQRLQKLERRFQETEEPLEESDMKE